MTLYWRLRNKDPIIQKYSQERVETIVKEFKKIVDEYCKGSYENVFATDDPLHRKSNLRLDFMMNVYRRIIENATFELGELENEMDKRM